LGFYSTIFHICNRRGYLSYMEKNRLGGEMKKQKEMIEEILDELEDLVNEDDVIEVVPEEYENEFGKPAGVYFETYPGGKFREIIGNYLKKKLGRNNDQK